MSTAVELPRWDMAVVYPGLESPEFEAAFSGVIEDIRNLKDLFDRLGIEKVDSSGSVGGQAEALDQVLAAMNALLDRFGTLQAYIFAFTSTDSRDPVAQARMSELQQHSVTLSKLGVRFTAWLGSLDQAAIQDRSNEARRHAYVIERAQVEARHMMSPAEEELAAELELTGSTTWAKLHDDMTSQLMVNIDVNGEQPVPMTVVRNMAFSPDRAERRRGYEAELNAWESISVPLAAALNSIKGETLTLADRRHWAGPLDAALFHHSIDRQTLDAMLAAARESFPDFRRYLHAKARLLGVERCAFYDLFAPVGESAEPWEFDRSRNFIIDQFGTYSPRLSDFAARAFSEHWIDAEPRPGKAGGAFCMALRDDQSRILANYVASYDGMSTLAHELGHGYHNLNLAHQPALLRSHPTTLAETASIFCQTIVEQAALKNATSQEQLAIIESSLQDRCQVVVDITSRFLFESAVFERRKRRELSSQEFSEIMLDTQRETYGDGLDSSALHPYMWAVKGHYYGPTYYNYPYMFGLLFGLGLYARNLQDPEGFRAGYDELLASTGTADAATLAARFGIDLRDSAFWRSSLDVIRGQVTQFEQLVDESLRARS